MAPKPAAKGKDDFRARRLSVSEMEKSLPEGGRSSGASVSQSGGSGQKARRMSMSPEMGVIKPRATLPFPLEIVGTYSCHGVEPGIRAGETSAKINQDRGCVCYPFGDGTYNQALFCVFDGHGACGDKVSHFAMNTIQQKLEEHPALNNDPGKALKETFITVDEQLRKDNSIDAELSGTTAVVVIARVIENGNIMCYAANVGDSRAVMALKSNKLPSGGHVAKNLTEDQKPDTPAEMRRIKKKGGFVSPPEEEWGGPARVWLDANMTLPGLAMARSIGDHLVSAIGVCAEPEITQFEVKEDECKFMVMASDGVWEFIESQPSVDIVQAFIDSSATEACTRLIETAAAKWRSEEGDYRDDITAIVVKVGAVLFSGQ
jgi:serine/threonine protein phosphatase PrpC